MSNPSMKPIVNRLAQLERRLADAGRRVFPNGLADLLRDTRERLKAKRAERIAKDFPADLTTEERIGELRAKLAAWSKDGDGVEYSGDSKLGHRLFEANRRELANLLAKQAC